MAGGSRARPCSSTSPRAPSACRCSRRAAVSPTSPARPRGYLFGFLVAAVAVGWLAERGWDRSVWRTLGAMLIGTAIIFFFGIAWLSTLFGLREAIAAGLVPFLTSEAFKIALATAVVPIAWQLLHRR